MFDQNLQPLQHIPDVCLWHFVLQILGLMWAVSFSLVIGSYLLLTANILEQSIFIAAVTVTVATFTIAAKRSELCMRSVQR